MTDYITDKAIWSATKAWYLANPQGESWELLSEGERNALRTEYIQWRDSQPKSAAQLRSELRKTRIDNGILERKLAAAQARIRELEGFRETQR